MLPSCSRFTINPFLHRPFENIFILEVTFPYNFQTIKRFKYYLTIEILADWFSRFLFSFFLLLLHSDKEKETRAKKEKLGGNRKGKYLGPGKSNFFSKSVGFFNSFHGYLNQHKTLTQLSSLCKTSGDLLQLSPSGFLLSVEWRREKRKWIMRLAVSDVPSQRTGILSDVFSVCFHKNS